METDLFLWAVGWIAIIFGLPYAYDVRQLGKIWCPLVYCCLFTVVPIAIYVGGSMI